ncbi:MAG: oligosaccharide flippase family protein [Candidatus Bathyarchaeia archaeon]
MYLTVQNFLSVLIGVLGYAFLARVITQEEMGVVAGLTLLTALVQLLSDFGLNSAIAKFVSELKGRQTDVSVHVFSAFFFRILLGLLLTLIANSFFNIAWKPVLPACYHADCSGFPPAFSFISPEQRIAGSW